VASSLAHIATGLEHTRLGMDDDGFARLLARAAPMLDAIDTSGVPARLYLSRRPRLHRQLVNAAEVQGRFGAAGFVAHDFGAVPFAEQIRLIRGASWVVGPSGSALLTTIFGRPGLRIGALVPLGLFDVAWIGQACRHMGVDLTAIVGEVVDPHPDYPWLSDYRIDPELLDAYLETAVETSGASAPAATAGHSAGPSR
jgi:capsular polysaccharide biosynthesis protein